MHNENLSITAQINWVFTADLQAACKFYEQMPGFECVRDQGRARVFATAANAFIGVCEAFDGRVVDARGSLISLVVDDVDAWYRRLVTDQLDVDPPRRLDAFGIYAFKLRAVDGYTIEFQQFER